MKKKRKKVLRRKVGVNGKKMKKKRKKVLRRKVGVKEKKNQ